MMKKRHTNRLIILGLCIAASLYGMKRSADDDQRGPSRKKVKVEIDQVTLVSSDGKSVAVDKDLTQFSTTVSHMLEEVDDDAEPSIPLKNILGARLQVVLNDLKPIKGWYDAQSIDAPSLNIAERNKAAQEWTDAQSLSPHRFGELIELLNGANYLGIPELIELYARSMAIILSTDNGLDQFQQGNLVPVLNNMPPELQDRIRQYVAQKIRFYLREERIIPHTNSDDTDSDDLGTNIVRGFQFLADENKALIITNSFINIVDIETGLVQRIDHDGINADKYSMFPDGKKIALVTDNELVVVDLATQNEIMETPYGNSILGVSFSNNAKKMGVILDGNQGLITDIETGHTRAMPTDNTKTITRIDFAPGDKKVAAIYNNQNDHSGVVRIVNLDTGQVEQEVGHNQEISAVKFASNGKKMAMLSEPETIIFDLDSKAIKRTISHPDGILTFAFSLNGEKIGISTDYSGQVIDINTGHVERRVAHTLDVWRVEFSPNEQKVVTAALDDTAKVVDIKTGQERIIQHESGVSGAWFSKDGKKVITASDGGVIKVTQIMYGPFEQYQHFTLSQMLFGLLIDRAKMRNQTITIQPDSYLARVWHSISNDKKNQIKVFYGRALVLPESNEAQEG